MPLQSGDIRFARSAVMADVDSGGGPPTSQLLPDGASNTWFPDVSNDARITGITELRHGFLVLRNTDTDPLLGATIILAEPPDDENVSITLIKSPSSFARRPDLVRLIESSSVPGSEFNGFLLENHVTGQRNVFIAQRPGVEPPSVNTGLVLVQNEGQISQYQQYVRVRRVTVTVETRTMADGNGDPVDYQVQIANCELFSELEFDFPGSPPSRFYSRQANKTLTRTVNMNDAGTFYSASRLTAPVLATDKEFFLRSVYTQIVPNTRTETPLLNQRPGGLRTLELVDSQGVLQVTAAAHTDRFLVDEANQGYSWTGKMVPPPAPNSVALSGVFLGNWATVIDDGAGSFTGGPGGGTVNYETGDWAVTWTSMPDYNTFVLSSWADTAPFVNVCAAGQISLMQAPEFELDITPGSALSGATIEWPSGGGTRTATVSAAGVISGDATGLAIGALGKVWIKPTYMPDAGANFSLSYTSRPTVVQSLSSVSVDAGGFAALAFSQQPIPETVKVRWVTARRVSRSSGADQSGTGIRSVQSGMSTKSAYTETSDSSTSDTLTVVHTVNDDGAGTWGNPALGSLNYAGLSASLRLVDLAASTSGYRSDHEDVQVFAVAVTTMKG